MLLITSCRPAESLPYPWQTAEPGPAALHAVHSDRLRALMQDLQRQAFDRMPQELDDRPADRRRLRDIAAVAERMAESADRIPDVLADVRIAEPERRHFVELSRRLRDESRGLCDIAEAGRTNQLSGAMRTILATCTACHTAFRVLPNVSASPP